MSFSRNEIIEKKPTVTALGKLEYSAHNGYPVNHGGVINHDSKQPSNSQTHINEDINQGWVDLWHDIEAELSGLVKNLEQSYFQWQISLNVGLNPVISKVEWHTFLTQFREGILLLNKRVTNYNAQVSFAALQKPLYEADSIITKLFDQTG